MTPSPTGRSDEHSAEVSHALHQNGLPEVADVPFGEVLEFRLSLSCNRSDAQHTRDTFHSTAAAHFRGCLDAMQELLGSNGVHPYFNHQAHGALSAEIARLASGTISYQRFMESTPRFLDELHQGLVNLAAGMLQRCGKSEQQTTALIDQALRRFAPWLPESGALKINLDAVIADAAKVEYKPLLMA